MSHLKPIDDESEDIYNSVGYIKEMFSKNNCKYFSIFKDHQVQILKVECQSVTNPKP